MATPETGHPVPGLSTALVLRSEPYPKSGIIGTIDSWGLDGKGEFDCALEKGLVEADPGNPHIYRITDAGKSCVEENRGSIPRIIGSVHPAHAASAQSHPRWEHRS